MRSSLLAFLFLAVFAFAVVLVFVALGGGALS
jgi:hypothetical protein